MTTRAWAKASGLKSGCWIKNRENGRHPEKQGDLFLLKQLQGFGRFEGTLDDHRTARVEHRQREQPDAPDMKHGQHQQVPIPGGESAGPYPD